MTSDYRKAGQMAWRGGVGRRLAAGLLAGTVLAVGLPSFLAAADPNAPASDPYGAPAAFNAAPGAEEAQRARQTGEPQL